MPEIKTYTQVNKKDFSLNFEISKLENHYEKGRKKIPPPHRHDFFTVIISKKSKGLHYIDFNKYEFNDRQVFFVSPGQVHQVVLESKGYGYSLLFSTQFLLHNNIPISFIENLNLFNDYGHSPPLSLTEIQLKKLVNYCDDMLNYHQANLPFKEQAIGANLKLLLIQCNNACTAPKDDVQLMEAGQTILKRFKNIVEKYYFDWHSSSLYAKELNITPDHLNRTIKALIGKTAKEYIQTRITIAAKRMLYFTDLSAKEIGFELGFSEPANFSAFFKKQTQISPSNFRKNK